MSKWSNDGRLPFSRIYLSYAGQGMQPIAVNCAWSANPFSAGPPEGQSAVQVILKVDESIQIHGRYLSQINIVWDILGHVVLVRGVISIDEESLHLALLLLCQVGIMLFDVIGIEVALHRRGYTLEKYMGLLLYVVHLLMVAWTECESQTQSSCYAAQHYSINYDYDLTSLSYQFVR